MYWLAAGTPLISCKLQKCQALFLSFLGTALAAVAFLIVLGSVSLLLRARQFDTFFLWLSSGSWLLGLVGRTSVLAQRRVNHLVVLGYGGT